jgi:hypothetical protein
MNSRNLTPLAVIGTCLLLAGCVTAPSAPVVYQVPITQPVIRSDFGPPNLAVTGVQDVPAQPGAPLYYQVISPVNVVAYAFDRINPGPGGPLLAQFQGTSFYSSVTPSGSAVEFVFSAAQPVMGGSVQLFVSDRPIIAGSVAIPYTTPVPPLAIQPPVTISPLNTTTAVGQPVTFSVSGGAGTGAYVWGGAAVASGISNQYTFNQPGSYTVTVYRSGDASYAQSNLASATANITPAPVQPAAVYPASSPAVTVTPLQ